MAGRATVTRPSIVVTTPTASEVWASIGIGRSAPASAAITASVVHRLIV
jgi:hypothetical protein